MKKLYLHIGPHKTGSTYLQKALHVNQNELLNHGLLYPSDPASSNYAHHKLAELYWSKSFQQTQKITQEIIRIGSNDLILSSENFDRLDVDSISQIKKDFKGYDVKVIFFSRNIPDLLVSNWQEDVKHGYTLSWGEYAYVHFLKPFESKVINKSKVLDAYAEVFGKSSISILDYTHNEDKNIDIFEALMSNVDVDITIRKDKNIRINKSMDYSRIELIRALNSHFKSLNKKVNHHVRTAFLDYLKSNPKCSDVMAIEDIIKQHLVKVNMNSAFSVKHLNNLFMQKYEENISTEFSYDEADKYYELPSSDWVYNPIVSSKLKNLLLNVEKEYSKY